MVFRFRLAAAPTDDTIRLPIEPGEDLVDAGAGNDTIFVFEGADTVAGGSGNDNILGAQGPDELHGDGSVVLLSGGDHAVVEIATSVSDRDFITGGDDNDFVYGESDDDVLLGGVSAGRENSGQDVLNGGVGNDLLFGGAEPGAGATDHILGGNSNLIDFSAIAKASGIKGAGTGPGVFIEPRYLERDIVQILRPAGATLKFEYQPPDNYLLPDFSTAVGGRVKVTTTMPDKSIATDFLYDVEYAKIYDVVGDLLSDATAYWNATTPEARAAVFSPTSLIPLTQWTFEIGRYANGTGSLTLLRNGSAVASADPDGTTNLSVLANSDNLISSSGSKAKIAFAWDDTTPVDSGTYDAI